MSPSELGGIAMKLLRKSQVAEMLSVSVKTVERMINRRELQVVKICGVVRVLPSSLDNCIKSHMQ